MPVVQRFIPLTQWTPDRGIYSNDGAVLVENLWPVGTSEYATPLILQSVKTLTGLAVGSLVIHPDGPNLYYGTTADLYQVDAQFPYTETVRSGAVYTPDATSRYWRFLVWGGDVLAAGGYTQRPQYRDADAGAGNFADLLDATSLANNDLKPRYMAAMGLRVLFANMVNATAGTTLPHRVWWSATNNARRFGTSATDPALRTGFQDLFDDYGQIMGICAGADYAYIFKQRAIYRMSLGGAFGFDFRLVTTQYGTTSDRSLVPVGDDVYFWSESGPAVLRSGGQVVPLANAAMSRYLLEQSLPEGVPITHYVSCVTPSAVIGWYDASSRSVCWTYNAQNDDVVANNPIVTLVVSTESGRMGYYNHTFDLEAVGGETEANGYFSPTLVATRPFVSTDKWEFGAQSYFFHNDSLGGYKLLRWNKRRTRPCTVILQSVTPRNLLGVEEAKILRVRPRYAMTCPYNVTSTAQLIVSWRAYQAIGRRGFRSYTVTASQSGSVTETLASGLDTQGWVDVETMSAVDFELTFRFTNFAYGSPSFTDVAERIYELDGFDIEFETGAAR